NPPITHALMLMMLSTSLALLAASPGQQIIATFSALVFGLAYMSLTGLYLMTSIRLLPGRLAMGPVLPFVAVSLGQAAGSPIVGKLVDGFGYTDSFAMFAVFGTLAAMISPLYPRYLEVELPEEEIEDETGLQAAFDYQLQDEDGEPLDIASGEAQEPYVAGHENR
ncbi:MAG: MFS transporter, partial [Desulfuromonadaceae bacterium]